jgi:HSP20 family molecular chaperone IbpA
MTKQTETTKRETTRSAQYFTPRVDIFETESDLLLLADMPGVAPNDIDLRYEQGELILQGKETPWPKVGHPIHAEFEDGDYYRVFQIHESIDASRIEAECKNGVLTVHLPKVESAKPRQVTVKAK